MKKILILLLLTLSVVTSSEMGVIYNLSQDKKSGFLLLREKPKAKVIGKLYNSDKLEILNKDSKYYKVKDIKSGKIGYAHSDWIEIETKPTPIEPIVEEKKQSSKDLNTTPVTIEPIKLTSDNLDEEIKRGVTVVDFWAPWCAPCRVIAPIIEELAKDYRDRVTIAKVNTDEEQDIASKYQIRSLPTILFFRDGEVIDIMVGRQSKEDFVEKIDYILEK